MCMEIIWKVHHFQVLDGKKLKALTVNKFIKNMLNIKLIKLTS